MTTALRAWSRRSAAAAGMAAALLAGGSSPALAALSQSPAPSFQTDSTVHAMVRVGGVVYIAGSFLNVRPAGAPLGAAPPCAAPPQANPNVERVNAAVARATSSTGYPAAAATATPTSATLAGSFSRPRWGTGAR